MAGLVLLLLVGVFTLQLIREGWFVNRTDNGMDPTTQTFAVRLLNDSNDPITAKQCNPGCKSFHDQFRLAPGDSATVNTSDQNADNYWLIVAASGTRVGRLDLKYDHKVLGAVVYISAAGPCP